MEFYTINPKSFNREVFIEDFESAIWTERFVEAGDAKLVVPATHEMVKLLMPGTLLSLKASADIILLDTREIQDGMMTVSGKTLEAFLQYRWTQRASYKATRPRFLLYALVSMAMTQAPTLYFSNIEGLRSRIPEADPTERLVNQKWKPGPAYPTMLEIANKYKIDMSIKRTTNSDTGDHELVFTTRYGQDRSRSQAPGTFNNIVRFSPDLENLENVKELRSDVDYINWVTVYPPTIQKFPTAPSGFPGIKNLHNPSDGNLVVTMPDNNPFERRFTEVYMDDVVTAEDIAEQTSGNKDGPLWPIGYVDIVDDMMHDQAEKIFAAHRRSKVVEGEVVPGTQFEYKRDYDLGDFVDIDGNYGSPIKGRVMEYIRSQDATGERAYPTISANPDPNTMQSS